MKRLLGLWLLLLTFCVQAQGGLLPADKALAFKAEVVNDEILLHWKIAKGYYLYKEKISILADSPERLGKVKFPKAKVKNDEFFGNIGTYRNNVTVSVPVLPGKEKSILLSVSYQGCADVDDVCYPTIKKSVKLDISKFYQPPPSLVGGAFDFFSQAQNEAKSLLNTVLPSGASEPLHPDEAFRFTTVVKDKNTVLARWDIRKDYYLYHNKFAFEAKGAALGEIIIPAGKVKNDPLFGVVETHTDKLEIVIPLKNTQTPNPVLTVKYQGCWEGGVCYPPQEKSVNIDLSSAKGGTQVSAPTKVSTPTNPLLNEADQITAMLQHDNILWVLLSFFGFGLLLSLTPCVFPMIPILSGIIIGQEGAISTKRAVMISIVFVLAMSATYSTAGVLAGYFGENLQALFQTPWILVVFSLVFVALAFSMFGFYQIQLPKKLQTKITNISNKQTGGHFLGVAIMGLLSALIVGPCVAPPLAGALIYIGQTGDAALGGLSLFVLSIGMGVPLILIGAGVSKLPRAGAWMDNIKYIFGILMLAVAIYLLDRIIPPIASLALWASLATIAPIAMGALNTQRSDSTPWQRIFKAIGLIILGYGILLWGLVARGGGDMLAPLSDWGGAPTEQTHIQFSKVTSNAELNQVLTTSKNNGQIVMLDFYAEWCIACKELERFVFADAEVVAGMKNVITLQADVTKNNADDKALMRRFDIVGPPAILFFKDGVENRSQRIIGEISAKKFLQHLEKSQ